MLKLLCLNMALQLVIKIRTEIHLNWMSVKSNEEKWSYINFLFLSFNVFSWIQIEVLKEYAQIYIEQSLRKKCHEIWVIKFRWKYCSVFVLFSWNILKSYRIIIWTISSHNTITTFLLKFWLIEWNKLIVSVKTSGVQSLNKKFIV